MNLRHDSCCEGGGATFRGDHDFKSERCLRPLRPSHVRGKGGKGGGSGGAGGKGGRAEAQQRQPSQTPWWATGPQPPPSSELQPQATPQAPQWGQSRPPQRSGGRGDDLGAYAGAGFEGYGPSPNSELASRILLCCKYEPTREVSGLDDSDKYDCTREGYVAISNPFRVSDIVESGEARDHAEGRGMASAYFAALVQNVQQGTPFEGSLFERAYTKGFVADADWRRLNDDPERMLDAIDGIAKKVARGRTIALGCSCPMDGGACHRIVLRRAILQAAERKRREIDSRLYERSQGRHRRSRSRSPPLFGEQRSHSPQRSGGRFGVQRTRSPQRRGGRLGPEQQRFG